MSVDSKKAENSDSDKNPQPRMMHKRPETMADGRRYLIYYTFENGDELKVTKENINLQSEAQKDV